MLYDPSSEHFVTTMKTTKKFSEIEERHILNSGDIFLNSVPIEKLGDNKIQIGEVVCDISKDFQKVFIDTTVNSIENFERYR